MYGSFLTSQMGGVQAVQEPRKKNIGTLEVVFGKILSRCNRKMFSKILLSNLNVAIFALMWRIFEFQWITDVIVNSIYSFVWVWRKCSQSHESSQGTVNGVRYWEARPRAHFFSAKDAPTDMPAPPVMVLLMLTRIASNPRCGHFCPSLFIIFQKVQLCITKLCTVAVNHPEGRGCFQNQLSILKSIGSIMVYKTTECSKNTEQVWYMSGEEMGRPCVFCYWVGRKI